MRLGLQDYRKPFQDDRGVIRIDGRDLVVVDLNSGEPIENMVAMTWGSASMLAGFEGSLLTSEHVKEGKDYLVVVVECTHAMRFDKLEKEKCP